MPLPALSPDQATADELASSHLNGADYCATIGAASLRRMRWSNSVREALAIGRRDWQTAWSEGITERGALRAHGQIANQLGCFRIAPSNARPSVVAEAI